MAPPRKSFLDQLGLTNLTPRNTPLSGRLQDLVPPNRMALQEGAGAVDSQVQEIPLSQQTREISPDVSSQVSEISRQMSRAQVQDKDRDAVYWGVTKRTEEGDRRFWDDAMQITGGPSKNDQRDAWVEGRNNGTIFPEIPIDPGVTEDSLRFKKTDDASPQGGFMVRQPRGEGILEGGEQAIGRMIFSSSHVLSPVIATIGESMLDATTRKEVSAAFPREELFPSIQDDPRWKALAPDEQNNYEKLGHDAVNVLSYFIGPAAIRGTFGLAKTGYKAVTTPGTTLPAVSKAVEGLKNIYSIGASKTIKLGGQLSIRPALDKIAQLYNRLPPQIRAPLETIATMGRDRVGPPIVRTGQRLATGKTLQNIGYMGSEGFSDALLTAAQGGGAREVYNAMLLGTFGGPIIGGLIGKVGSLATVPVIRKYMNWLLPEAALHVALKQARRKAQSAVRMTPKLDEAGKIVKGADGEPLMVPWKDPITGQTSPVHAGLDPDELPEGAKPGLFQQGGALENSPFSLAAYFKPDRGTVVSEWFNAGTEHARKLRDFMKQGFDFNNGWGIVGFIGDRTSELDDILKGVLRRTDLPQGEELAKLMPGVQQSFGVIQDVWRKFADEPFVRQMLDPDTGEALIPKGSLPMANIARRLHTLVDELSFAMPQEEVGRALGRKVQDLVEAGTARVPLPALEGGLNVSALTVEKIYEMRRLLDELGNFSMLQTGSKPAIDLGPMFIEKMRGAAGVLRNGIEKAAPDTKGIFKDLSRYLEARDGITQYLVSRGNPGDAALAAGQNLLVGTLAGNKTRMWAGGIQGGTIRGDADRLDLMVDIGETYMKGMSLITAGAQSFFYYNNKEAIMTGTASAPWDLVTTYARHVWASGEQPVTGQPNRPRVETIAADEPLPMETGLPGQQITVDDYRRTQRPNYFLNPVTATLGSDDDSYLPTTRTGRDLDRPGMMGGREATGYEGEANFWVDWFNSMIGMYKFTDRDGETEARELETPDQS